MRTLMLSIEVPEERDEAAVARRLLETGLKLVIDLDVRVSSFYSSTDDADDDEVYRYRPLDDLTLDDLTARPDENGGAAP